MNLTNTMIEQTNTSKAIHVVGPTRQDRGRKIYEAGGQIRHVGDGSYTILSQTTPDTLYTLDRNGRGWTVHALTKPYTASTHGRWSGGWESMPAPTGDSSYIAPDTYKRWPTATIRSRHRAPTKDTRFASLSAVGDVHVPTIWRGSQYASTFRPYSSRAGSARSCRFRMKSGA